MLAFGSGNGVSGQLKAYTKRTITDSRRLAAELERVRKVGFAEAIGEREEHLNAIAAPIFGARGELAAIMGVQGPALRFNRDAMRTAVRPLLSRTSAVSATLGVPPD
jgi:DNA-binding IclR family transcriptional regulator